ncbi:MAG TPA: response regulator [Candidatus Limnocylindrales bacterium]|nr:response regulator [Candidatus Limnocylindrales bacterium]
MAQSNAAAPIVLVLDDDPNTLLVLNSLLDSLNVQVIACEDESCALRCAQELLRPLDIMVADVVLNGTNGPAVARQVIPLQPAMRLLFISGFSLADLGRRALLHPDDVRPGSVEFLQKPFAAEDFLAAVNHLLAASASSR